MRWVAAALLAFALVAAITVAFLRRPHLPSAEKGRRLAERSGCFACHGPGGIRGSANPGRTDPTVPNFEGDVMMYAETAPEIREWIRDGVTKKRAASRTWKADRDRGTLRMPAFRYRMNGRQIEDLVAYVMAMAGMPEPDDSLAVLGLRRSEELGCVGCHGPGGRLARPNPRSWKGYVPSWDGADFPELVRDSTEFREWIQRGVASRFERDPLSRFFLRRAVLKMPAYGRHLSAGDVPALWAYVQWLRSNGSGE